MGSTFLDITAAKLVGRRAAVVAGVLLAAELFLVGHSHVSHTDARVTMFGALAVVALAAAVHDPDAPVDRKLLVVAGIAMPCGDVVPAADAGPGDYVIRYISGTQQSPDNPIQRDVMRHGDLVTEFEFFGVTNAELWQYPE